MTVEEMHYDFKRKLNKVDSEQNMNLLPQEIDMALNEAQDFFVRTVAEPRIKNHLGFETTHRTTDDIRTIVVENQQLVALPNSTYQLPSTTNLEYMYFIRAYCVGNTESCDNIKCNIIIQRHGDLFEESEFTKSNVKWREINGVFNQEGLKLYIPDGFNIDPLSIDNGVYLTYIRKPLRIAIGNYLLPDGTTQTVKTSCELPIQIHSEIVDIAVAFTMNSIGSQDYQLKLQKLTLNELK